MANYENLKSAIQQVVKTNGNNAITGALLQQSLLLLRIFHLHLPLYLQIIFPNLLKYNHNFPLDFRHKY